MKRVLAVAAILVTSVVAMPHAEAGPRDCGRAGEACTWVDINYPGHPSARWTWQFSWGRHGNASSVKNNGTSRTLRACFYGESNYKGLLFRMNNPGQGGQYQDPDLRNGVNGNRSNFNDRIRSANFC